MILPCTIFISATELNKDSTDIFTYPELAAAVKNYRDKPEEQWKYITIWIRKSKKENNPEQLYEGYNQAGYIKTDLLQIKYCDSMVTIAKKLDNQEMIADSYLTLGTAYMGNEFYPEALNNFMEGYKLISEKKSPYIFHNTEYLIARTKFYLGQYSEAREILNRCVVFFRDHDEKIGNTDYRNYYVYSLIALIESNSHLGKFNENKKLIFEGIQYISAENLPEYSGYFRSSEGQDAYLSKNYPLAVLKLNEALSLYHDHWKHLTDRYYLGMAYWKLDEKDKAASYLLLLDQIYNENKRIDPQFRPAFETLISYYKEKGDTQKQLEYIDKLMALDKIYEKDYKYLYRTLNKDYDTRRLTEEKLNLENTLKWERFLYGSLSVLGLLLTGFIAYHFFRQYKRNKYYKKLYADLKKSAEIKETIHSRNKINRKGEDVIVISKELGINPIKTESIMQALHQFEDEKAFLSREISLSSLAGICGTNTSYLSKILNHYKHENFAAYINNLRLQYIVEEWERNPKTRHLSIQDIAEKLGYKSTQAFSKNFQERYLIPPSYFLNRLNEEKGL